MKYKQWINSFAFMVIGIFIGWLIFGLNNEPKVNNDLNISMEDLTGDMMENLQSKKGDDLDKTFLEYLSTHQWGDINIAGVAMDNSSNEKIKSFAGSILTSESSNMEIIKKLQDELNNR
jgi:uncharacterized protein (DUF305 family)